MNRINSSRQSISAKQRNVNYRSDGTVASHVGRETVVDATITEQVSWSDEYNCWLVASRKFPSTFYKVSREGACSASDERVKQYCVAQVQAYCQLAA